jgi:hypothetical protein
MELVLGLWLLIASWVLPPPEWLWLPWHDGACGLAVLVLSVQALRRRDRTHLAIAGIGLWLVVLPFLLHTHPAPPWAQHQILTGLVLLMLGIIPTPADRPPAGWDTARHTNTPTP